MNRVNTHSWVRISHGSNKFVMNLNNNEQETSEVQLEEYTLKLNASDVACRSKAKAKPQRRESASSSTRTIPIGGRTWIDVEPGKYSFSDFEVSKKVMYLLRHSQQVHRQEDGAVHFWRIKENLQKYFLYCPHWSDSKWKACMTGGGGNKNRFQYCGHSGRNLIDPSLQDNVIIQSNFFQYIYHVGCAINLHSIISSGSIPGGQNLSNRQTVFFCLWIPWTKTTRILTRSTWKHRVMHNTCIKHGRNIKTQFFLGRHQSCYEERIEDLSDSIERDHSSRNTSSLLYSESCQDGNWRSHIRKSLHVTSAATKDLLETRLEKRIGFRTCSTTRRTSCATIQKFPIEPTNSKSKS